MEIQGETLYAGIDSDGTPAEYVYTPWMPQEGDAAVFAVQILKVSSVTLTWGVETKNSEDTDASAAASPAVSDRTMTTVSVDYSSVATGLKELVRYRFATGSTDSTDWVYFRPLEPSWQHN